MNSWLVACLMALCLHLNEAIMFSLQPNTVKCLREEIHKNILVYVDYNVIQAVGQKVDIRVGNIACWLNN